MIRKLRKKFIVAAIVAVILVLLILIGAINVLNYRSLVAEADDTLQILADNKGSFPRQMLREQDRPSGQGMPSEPQPTPEEREGASFAFRGGNRELAYQARYFAAWFAADGSIARINLDNLASLTEDEAAALAESVYAAGKMQGFSDGYRWCRTVCDGETMLLFLNCERELSTFRSFLYASIGISLAGTLAVFLLLLLISGRIVRPIAESYKNRSASSPTPGMS